jgi:hypothetical protein
MARKKAQAEAQSDLDYRAHYQPPMPVPVEPYDYRQQVGNPWTAGQLFMLAGGAIAVGGAAYWIYTVMQKRRAEQNPVQQLRVVGPRGARPHPVAAAPTAA